MSPNPSVGLRLCLVSALIVSLAACSDDDDADDVPLPDAGGPMTAPEGSTPLPPEGEDGGDQPQFLQRLGVVGLVDDGSADAPSASARFVRYEPDADVQDFYGALGVNPDTCSTGADAFDAAFGTPVLEIPERIDGSTPTDIDAGEVLTLTSDAGSYGELQRVADGSGTSYAAVEGSLERPVPAESTLDIPGAAFPAFADIPVVSPRAPAGFAPDVGEPVGDDTSFTWTAGDDGDATVRIAITTTDGGTLACVLEDDGEFAFADAVGGAVQVGGGGAGGELVAVGRRTISVRSEGADWLYVDSFAGSLPPR